MNTDASTSTAGPSTIEPSIANTNVEMLFDSEVPAEYSITLPLVAGYLRLYHGKALTISLAREKMTSLMAKPTGHFTKVTFQNLPPKFLTAHQQTLAE